MNAREKKCRVDGCGRAYRSRDYCWKHLEEAKARGDELVDHRSDGPLPDVECRVDGCDRLSDYRVKRLCQMHYRRLSKHGTAELPEPPTRRDVLDSGYVVRESGCWEWTGAVSSAGYGRLGASDYAHRASHEEFVGPIPDGHEVDHLCRNRICINPAHLEAVTKRENLLRQLANMERDKANGRLLKASDHPISGLPVRS